MTKQIKLGQVKAWQLFKTKKVKLENILPWSISNHFENPEPAKAKEIISNTSREVLADLSCNLTGLNG